MTEDELDDLCWSVYEMICNTEDIVRDLDAVLDALFEYNDEQS